MVQKGPYLSSCPCVCPLRNGVRRSLCTSPVAAAWIVSTSAAAGLDSPCPTEQRGTRPSARSWDTRYPNPAGHPCPPKEGLQYRYSLYRNFFPFGGILKVTVGKISSNFPQSETLIPSVVVYPACSWGAKSVLLCLKINGRALHTPVLANVSAATLEKVT